MSADLDLNFTEITSQLEKLDKAISDFEPYSKNFVSDTLKSFEGFNSDFISKMETTLDNMRDTEAPKLIKELKSFSKAIKEMSEAFNDVDAQYATGMKGE